MALTPYQPGERVRHLVNLGAGGTGLTNAVVTRVEPRPGANDLIEKHSAERTGTCGNCAEPIRGTVVARGPVMDPEPVVVWDHPTHGHHTVCDWHEGMAPTDRVATPALVAA